jgi:hypothetical protein
VGKRSLFDGWCFQGCVPTYGTVWLRHDEGNLKTVIAVQAFKDRHRKRGGAVKMEAIGHNHFV